MFANNWLHLLVGTLPCVADGDNHQDISGNALASYMAAGDAITLVPSDADDDSNLAIVTSFGGTFISPTNDPFMSCLD